MCVVIYSTELCTGHYPMPVPRFVTDGQMSPFAEEGNREGGGQLMFTGERWREWCHGMVDAIYNLTEQAR